MVLSIVYIIIIVLLRENSKYSRLYRDINNTPNIQKLKQFNLN